MPLLYENTHVKMKDVISYIFSELVTHNHKKLYRRLNCFISRMCSRGLLSNSGAIGRCGKVATYISIEMTDGL